MEMLKALLDSPAVNVFLGTTPLLGAIIWELVQNDRRFQSLDKRMDVLDKRMDGIEQRLGRIEGRIDAIDVKLAVVSERLVKVETGLEGGHVVLSR